MVETTQIDYKDVLSTLDENLDPETQELLFVAAQETFRYRSTPDHKVTSAMNVGAVAYYIEEQEPREIKFIPSASQGTGRDSHSEKRLISQLIFELKKLGYRGTDQIILAKVRLVLFSERGPCRGGYNPCDEFLNEKLDEEKHKVYHVIDYKGTSKQMTEALDKEIERAKLEFKPERTFENLQEEIESKEKSPSKYGGSNKKSRGKVSLSEISDSAPEFPAPKKHKANDGEAQPINLTVMYKELQQKKPVETALYTNKQMTHLLKYYLEKKNVDILGPLEIHDFHKKKALLLKKLQAYHQLHNEKVENSLINDKYKLLVPIKLKSKYWVLLYIEKSSATPNIYVFDPFRNKFDTQLESALSNRITYFSYEDQIIDAPHWTGNQDANDSGSLVVMAAISLVDTGEFPHADIDTQYEKSAQQSILAENEKIKEHRASDQSLAQLMTRRDSPINSGLAAQKNLAQKSRSSIEDKEFSNGVQYKPIKNGKEYFHYVYLDYSLQARCQSIIEGEAGIKSPYYQPNTFADGNERLQMQIGFSTAEAAKQLLRKLEEAIVNKLQRTPFSRQ